MSLFPYILLSYIARGVQIGLGRFITWHGAQPNLGLIAVVFIALNAPREAALLGAFAIGALQDLLTAQPPGLFAISYGLTAMIVTGAQSVVTRGHPLTHIMMTLLGGAATTIVLLLHSFIWARGNVEGATPIAIKLSIVTLLISIAYTAILAPFVMAPLYRVRKIFSFTPRRRARAY
jgi:rod shape-determining protein MreD